MNAIESRIPGILVIDDEIGTRESIRFTLDSFCTVKTAPSVEEGLDYLKEQQVDTIVLDLNLPGMTGFDGIPYIRQLDDDVSIVICTASSLCREKRDVLRELGADEFINKPFEVRTLIDLCKTSIFSTTQRREVTASTLVGFDEETIW